MKTPRIQNLSVLTASAALAISTLAAIAGPGPNHGTDIIHLSIQAPLTNEGIVTNASGSARIDWHKQGNANHQSLQVNVHGLDANASYELAALLDDDTNLTSAITFTTDANGNASINLEDKGHTNNGHGHGHANGHNKHGRWKDQL